MKRIILAFAFLSVAFASKAYAQTPASFGTYVVTACGGSLPVPFVAGRFGPPVMDINGNLCTNASIGSVTIGTVGQGTPAPVANSWPVYLSQAGTAVGSGNPLYVQGSFSATSTGFIVANTNSLNVSTTSAHLTALPPGGTQILVSNPTSAQVNVLLDTTTTTVTATNSTPIQPGGCQLFNTNGTFTSLDAILASGTGTIIVQSGSGIPLACTGNNNGISVAQGTAASYSAPWPVALSIGGAANAVNNPIFVNVENFPSTQSVTQSGTWTVNAVQSGTWNIGAITSLPAITGTVNLGTLNGAALAANQPTNSAQGATTSGQTGALAFGAASTSSPTDVTGDSYPLSLTTAGALRTDSSATTQPISASALPLPSGAATSALQTNVQAAAGSSSSSAVGVQGVSGGLAVPISAASLPLPTGGATSANQTSVESSPGGTSSQVLNIQGNASGTPIPISGIVTTTFDGFIVSGVNSITVNGGIQHIPINGSGSQVLVSNTTNYELYAILDTGSASPSTTNSTPIPAGNCQLFNTNGTATDVAILSAGSSGTVIVQSGTGTPLSCAGGSGSGSGGTVVQGAGSSFSAPWYFALSQGGVANSATAPIFTQLTAGTAAIGSISLTQGGSALSATNGLYSNLLQGNAALSDTNGLYVAPTTSSVFSTSAASGAYVDGAFTTIGAEANSACAATTGPCTLIAIEKLIANSVSGPIPAGTNTIGAVTQGSSGTPFTTSLNQVAGTVLGSGAIVAYGGNPASVAVPAVNAFVTNNPTVLQGGGAWSQSITSPLGAATASTAAVSTTPVYQNINLTTSPSVAVEGGGYLITPYASNWGTGPETITISENLSSGASTTLSPSGGISSNITPYCVQLAQGATVQYAVASGSGATGLSINLAGSPGCASGGGSSTVAQGTAAALSGAWPLEITDGTHGPVAVKAASTPPALTDPALVVASLPPSYTLLNGVNATGAGPVVPVNGGCYLIDASGTFGTGTSISITATDSVSGQVKTLTPITAVTTTSVAYSPGSGVNMQATVSVANPTGLYVRMVGTNPGACSNGGGSSSTVTLATQSPGVSVGGVGITPPTYSQGGHITPIVSTVLESTHTFNPNSGLGANLYGIYANNTGSQSGFLVCVNGTSISAGAITPLDFTQINANSNANINYMPGPAAAYSIAITCAVTVASTPFTYTSPGNVVAFHGMVN